MAKFHLLWITEMPEARIWEKETLTSAQIGHTNIHEIMQLLWIDFTLWSISFHMYFNYAMRRNVKDAKMRSRWGTWNTTAARNRQTSVKTCSSPLEMKIHNLKPAQGWIDTMNVLINKSPPLMIGLQDKEWYLTVGKQWPSRDDALCLGRQKLEGGHVSWHMIYMIRQMLAAIHCISHEFGRLSKLQTLPRQAQASPDTIIQAGIYHKYANWSKAEEINHVISLMNHMLISQREIHQHISQRY